MDRIQDTIRGEKIARLREQLKQLESRQIIEEKTIAQHQEALQEIESEMETLKVDLAKLEKGMPLESGQSLQYSRGIKRN